MQEVRENRARRNRMRGTVKLASSDRKGGKSGHQKTFQTETSNQTIHPRTPNVTSTNNEQQQSSKAKLNKITSHPSEDRNGGRSGHRKTFQTETISQTIRPRTPNVTSTNKEQQQSSKAKLNKETLHPSEEHNKPKDAKTTANPDFSMKEREICPTQQPKESPVHVVATNITRTYQSLATSANILCNGTQVEALIDSGAATSKVSAEVARDCGLSIQPLAGDRVWKAANGSSIDVLGAADAILKFGKTEIQCEVVVAQKLAHDLIVGTDVLKAHGFRIFFGGRFYVVPAVVAQNGKGQIPVVVINNTEKRMLIRKRKRYAR